MHNDDINTDIEAINGTELMIDNLVTIKYIMQVLFM